ncbi:hypothetical protein GZ78_05525 [Endozoicomonas numazuensis]|uniref:Uncharacterized protein n=2 Tax=Endozoicomonas numazuensis TaxID=1137799 RepID=A0A081NLU0_9GAMM|nr:hypothetical protein GZ78_05525 [Endozoicomonas numazuensis]
MDSAQACPRHVFIDQMLYFTGRLSRSDLVSVFGVGVATASRDISAFTSSLKEPDCVISRGREGYWARENYKPKFNHNPEVALDLMTSSLVKHWVDKPNYGHNQPLSYKSLEAEVIAPITCALVAQKPVQLLYQTSGNNGLERLVVPIALFVASGFRYVRVYEINRQRFITLKLTRVISSSLDTQSQRITIPVDEEWSRQVILSIGAHPYHPSKESIERDYGLPRDGIKNYSVTAGFAGYLLAEWRVDCSGAGFLDPIQYPFTLANRQELEEVNSLEIAPGFQVSDYSFTVVISSVEKITNDLEKTIYESGCSDGLLCETDGAVSLRLRRTHLSLDQAIGSVLKKLSSCGLNQLKVIFQ